MERLATLAIAASLFFAAPAAHAGDALPPGITSVLPPAPSVDPQPTPSAPAYVPPLRAHQGDTQMKYVLLVTGFYYGQPPATTQLEMLNSDFCIAAQRTVQYDAARIEAEIKHQQGEDAKHGVISNPIIPLVSATCVPSGTTSIFN